MCIAIPRETINAAYSGTPPGGWMNQNATMYRSVELKRPMKTTRELVRGSCDLVRDQPGTTNGSGNIGKAAWNATFQPGSQSGR
jgi:hypothetical protein